MSVKHMLLFAAEAEEYHEQLDTCEQMEQMYECKSFFNMIFCACCACGCGCGLQCLLSEIHTLKDNDWVFEGGIWSRGTPPSPSKDEPR